MTFQGYGPDDVGKMNPRFKIYSHDPIGWRWILRDDIPALFTEDLFDAIHLWKRWKRFGLPHGGGWLDEGERIIQLINIVEDEWNLYESGERESAREKSSGGSRGTKSYRSRRG